MAKVTLILACLASAGHGLRANALSEGNSGGLPENVKQLEELLLAFNPAGAWATPRGAWATPRGPVSTRHSLRAARSFPARQRLPLMEAAVAEAEDTVEGETADLSDGQHRRRWLAERPAEPEDEVASVSDSDAGLTSEEPVVVEGGVSSWYDRGIRLTTEEPEPAVEEEEESADWYDRPEGEVSSWYDSGIRLVGEQPVEPEPSDEESDEKKARVVARLEREVAKARAELQQAQEEEEEVRAAISPISASTQASLAAALISATAVLGVDLAALGGAESAELGILAGALALSQVNSNSTVGSALRTVGNVSSTVYNVIVGPTLNAAGNFAKEKEIGWYIRAGLELAIEQAIYTVSPGRKAEAEAERAAQSQAKARRLEAERRAMEAEQLAREAAERQAYKDSLPFWNPEKYQD